MNCSKHGVAAATATAVECTQQHSNNYMKICVNRIAQFGSI